LTVEDGSRGHLTPIGIALIVAFVIGLLALFLPVSHTVQVIGFAMVTIVGIVFLIEFRPKRARNRPQPLRDRTGYLPGTARVVDPTWNDGDAAIRREDADRERRPGRGA
jgi:membrane protein implicated in regulation of membrane protease activity